MLMLHVRQMVVAQGTADVVNGTFRIQKPIVAKGLIAIFKGVSEVIRSAQLSRLSPVLWHS